MKATIRVKLTKDAEKALMIISGSKDVGKKHVIDLLIDNASEILCKKFIKLEHGGEAKILDNKRIKIYKDAFDDKCGELKTYAISNSSKAKLKKVSKELGITMGLSLSILLEDFIKGLVAEIDREPKVNELLNKLFMHKSKIHDDAMEMYKLWQKLLSLYPEKEKDSPFYDELMYFFEGFFQFSNRKSND
jgi:hypothetical protein